MKRVASKLMIVLMLWGVFAGFGTVRPVSATSGIEPYIGQIALFPYNFVPRGWLPCKGYNLKIFSNTALYSLIGTKFGGDGQTTFSLPNLTSPLEGTDYYIATAGIFPRFDGGVTEMLRGEILLLPYNGVLEGTLPCDGSLYSISQYPALFSLIGTNFGGDGYSNFRVPDLRTAVPDQESADGRSTRLGYFIVAEGLYPSREGPSGIQSLLGEIILTAYPYAAGSQTMCMGQQNMPVSQNNALYMVLGGRFGGTGSSYFGIPDLRGASPAKGVNYSLYLTGIFPNMP